MGFTVQSLEAIVGAACVKPWEALAATDQAGIQPAIAASNPACVVYPETSAQLAEVMACAHRNRWPVLPCGQGSKLTWGNPVRAAELVISTQRLNRIVDHAVGDFTVTVEAGTPFLALQTVLQGTRQFLAMDPAYPSQATLGGIVATRDTGALRHRYGGIRDMLIGLSFVRHDGQLAKAGGRVVKNVAGYDLMKLMTGAFGTLGVLTELTFRTYPIQELSQTVVLSGSRDGILAIAAEVRQSSLTPVAMDMLSAHLLPTLPAHPYGLALRFQSIAAGVAEQVTRLTAIAAPHALHIQHCTGPDDRQFWHTLNQCLFTLAPHPTTLIAKVGVSPAAVDTLLACLQATLMEDSWQICLHAGSGLGILRLNAEVNTVSNLQTVRSHCQSLGGYLTLLAGPPAWKLSMDAWALPEAIKTLTQKLQNQFDPYHCLSPGRLV